MTRVLERVEPAEGSAAFEGDCAFCGIGSLRRPTWVFCADCLRNPAVCSACAEQAAAAAAEEGA